MEFKRGHLVLDACCLLNLYATTHITEILRALPAEVIVHKLVEEDELLTIPAMNSEGEGPPSIEKLSQVGALRVIDFDSQVEQQTFLKFAAEMGDDGESASCAVAHVRKWSVVTDDIKAAKFCTSMSIPQYFTLGLVRYWAEQREIDARTLGIALARVHEEGNYLPGSADPHKQWWKENVIRS